MAISWKPTQVINTPLSEKVIQQFNIRREILSKRNSITDQELKFLHSNTGWIKVSSGVDELINKDSDKDPQVNKLAKENILFGGVYNADTGIKAGILSDNSSYGFSEQYGYRPMAGITSFTIANLDTFGAVRKATIDFSVNSLEDLTKFEKLYLRPGFTAMLEFGHSITVKSPEENGPYYFENTGEYFDDFFDNIEGNGKDIEKKQDESEEDFKNRKIQYKNNSRLKKIELEIQRLREESGHNYDAMFGRISNFQWTYNVDTTYDCSFDVMGYGSVIESLSALSSENIADNDEENPSDAKTTVGKFNLILDLGVESDPFIAPREEAESTDETTDTEEQPEERNPTIAAVIHYACKEGEEEIKYSNEEDSDFAAAKFDTFANLQVGQVFEFIKGSDDPRFRKATTKAQREKLSGDTRWKVDEPTSRNKINTASGRNFIVVEVTKDGVTHRGFIVTTLMANIFKNEVLGDVGNNQPSTNPNFPFVPETIPYDKKLIRKVLSSTIKIAPDRQEFLNGKYVAPVSPPDLSKYTEKQVPVVEGFLARGYKPYNGPALLDKTPEENRDQGLATFTKSASLGRTSVVRVLSDGRSTDYTVI